MTRVPDHLDHLDHLADALSEDIVAAPAEQLVAEAAEDVGDGVAFAAAFDRVAARATRQARRRRIAHRIRAFVTSLAPRRSWRPALAVTAGLAVIAVAGDVYLHVRPQNQMASAPPVAAARDPVVAQERFIQGHLRAEPAAEAPPAAPAPQPSAAAVSPPAAPEQAAGSAGSRGHLTAIPAPARPQPAASEDRLRSLLKSEDAGADNDKRAKRQPAAPALLGGAIRADAPPSFVWPLRGRVIVRFEPAENGARSDGVDIAAPAGSDVHATEDGVVVYAGNDIKGYGNLILIRHRDDFVTAYAYASQLLVKRDDAVRRGQVIAKSGHGGPADQPMLHFEMRKGVSPVDPAQFLPPGGPAADAR